MAKKKTITTKKTSPKATYTPGKPFNLDVRTPDQAETLAAHLTQLKYSAGWLLMVQILEGNMAVMERAIITKIDPETGTKLTEAALDELRSKHAVMSELVNKPDQLIATFRKQSGGFVPAYDPYHVDMKQMLHEKKEDVKAGSPGTLTT